MTERYDELGGQPDAPDDLLAQFGSGLPAAVKQKVHPTALIGTLLRRATGRGWSVKELIHECSRDLGTADNVGAIVTRRLIHCAEHDHHAISSGGPTVAWCGKCAADTYRWETSPDHDPVRPCPRCSPQRNC